MDEHAWLTESFMEHRTRLRAVTYRMLGSLAEADEAVQDVWLRVSHLGAGEIDMGGSSGIIQGEGGGAQATGSYAWPYTVVNVPKLHTLSGPRLRALLAEGASKLTLV